MLTRLLLILLITNTIHAQTAAVNRTDTNGEKNGYWLQYLDLRLNPTDSADAYYKGFEFYDHGRLIYKFNEHKCFKRDSIVRSLTLPEKGRPVLVSGRFIWFFRKDTIPSSVRDFKEGYPVYETCNHTITKSGITWNLMAEVLEYTKRYQNIPGTHYYYEVNFGYPDEDRAPSISHRSWYYKKKSKWKYHRIRG